MIFGNIKFGYKLFLLIILVTIPDLKGQEKNDLDKEAKEKAKSVIRKYLPKAFEEGSHLLMSIGNMQFLIVKPMENYFLEYYLTLDGNSDLLKFEVKNIPQSERLMSNLFYSTSYHDGLINFDSEFYSKGYEKAFGSMTYFYFQDETNKKKGELRLSMVVSPIPMKEDLYYYLLQKIIDFNN